MVLVARADACHGQMEYRGHAQDVTKQTARINEVVGPNKC
jgi:hypothetical protein